jgi:UDP-3-O-[3-hydroxymyristoyl] glucosamine N-acyltransferase
MIVHTTTVAELAQWLDGKPEGDAQRRLTGVAPLESAGEGDVSFVEDERHLAQAAASGAGCLLIPPPLPLPSKTVIRVPNPRQAMARVIERLHPPEPHTPGIDPTARIGNDVTIGDDVSIGAYAVLGDRCRIGARTRIGENCVLGAGSVVGVDCLFYPRVTLYAGAQIGSRVILHSGCVIGSDGFGYLRDATGYHKFPQVGTVEIGDDVEIGANTTVDRGALGPTRIGRGTKIDNLVQVGHSAQIGEHCAIAALVGISGSVVIEDNVVIAGQVGIGDHVRIEKGAVLGGQCGILPHKVIRAGQTVWGTPARPLKEHLQQQALLARLSKRKRE